MLLVTKFAGPQPSHELMASSGIRAAVQQMCPIRSMTVSNRSAAEATGHLI
ncbi:hypothetical protein AB0I81_51030 [Nonomuraea sp. NPDC050404]|uniref:hypothetical protein n=1 Tax=Nonomuraea sp. NPDC050404 TaxID=3155783 RepID=UPI00340FD252